MKIPQQIDRFRHYFIADLPEDLCRRKNEAVEAYLDITILGEGTVGECVTIEDWGCAFDGQWMRQPVWITEPIREAEKQKAMRDYKK